MIAADADLYLYPDPEQGSVDLAMLPARPVSKDRRKKIATMEWIDAQKTARGCKHCGERDAACLDFHHRNPHEKIAPIRILIKKHSRPKLTAEIAKCDVLCSNCHRKLHAARRYMPPDFFLPGVNSSGWQ